MTDGLTYLLPYRGSFWRWRDQGEVLEWIDGPTIAFRGEVLAVLRRLAPQGLPPFDSVLLLLAATRDNWHELTAEPRILSGMLGALPADGAYAVQARGTLGAVLGELDRVRLMDGELRTPLEAKVVLCEIVFEGHEERTSREMAQAVLDLLQRGLAEEDLPHLRTPWLRGQSELHANLRSMCQGLRDFDPSALRLRLQTGLDQIPKPAEMELPPAERVRALLRELRKDEQLCGLAALASNLMAAVALPRSLADREELPIGGFSDIANRGSLDRLLLSELAHDDLTLAVRVAVNEALYLRRESPPRNPPSQRPVLLEAGIRSWGVPRVFATAVAMALVATSEHHTQVHVYRAAGSRVDPVDLTTRAGIVEHLAVLRPDLHPGEALDAFQKEIAEFEQAAEPVLVTTDDVADDPEFRRFLSQSGIAPFLQATVARTGRFRLTERTLHGERCVREAQLELEDLFAEPSRTTSKLCEASEDFPAILSMQPFPLRMPHNVDPNRTWSVGDRGVLSLTADRRLMFWTRRDRGAIQIADNLPKGNLLWWSAQDRSGKVRAVVGRPTLGDLRLLEIDLDAGRCVVHQVDNSQPVDAVFSHNGILFVLCRHGGKLDVIEEATGRRLQTVDFPHRSERRYGRFFQRRDRHGWYAVAYDGRQVCFEPVDGKRLRLIALFERDGIEGPIGVTERGHLYLTATDETRMIRHGLAGGVQVMAVSRDGKRIVLGQGPASRTQCSVVDVDTLVAHSRHGNPQVLVQPGFDIVRPVTLRSRFNQIAVDRRGVLTLFDRKGTPLGIDYDSASQRLRLRRNDFRRERPVGRIAFVPASPPPNVGYRLSVAAWSDGSRAFLDGRGLLHLKSADSRHVPEITIVLHERELSGWCSDGRCWGTPYYLGDEINTTSRTIFETVIRAFIQSLP